jgi:hypothetical protein
MSISIKTKREAVTATFGVPVDPEDVSYIDFMFARRHLATVRERGHRELRYIIEIDDLELAITTTLARIRERDGDKIFREAASFLREAVDWASENRHHLPRGKAREAAHV